MKRFKVINPLVALLLFQIGCFAQKTEEPSVSKTEKQVMATEPPSHFKKNMQSDAPLVTFIELGSVKCIPCKMMQPIMDEIEKEYAGQVNVVFYDVWTEAGKSYAQEYGIRVIPTQIFLNQDGNEYFRHEGYFPKEELVEVLKKQGVE